jgi:catechol 2,3-dioxygenase-like lactoylglutathione lyase family enzyme
LIGSHLGRAFCVVRPQAAATLARQAIGMGFPHISGFGHIDLTVTDCDRTVQWWQQVMGFRLITSRDTPSFKLRNVIHPSGFSVGFITHSIRASDRFDEHAVGLDHLALHVPDRPHLEAWTEHLDNLRVAHSGIQDEIGGPLIVFRDPDNIQLELQAFDPGLVRRGTHNTEWHL